MVKKISKKFQTFQTLNMLKHFKTIPKNCKYYIWESEGKYCGCTKNLLSDE